MTALVGAITAFGMLVVVPLAFALAPTPFPRVRVGWFVGAGLACLALALPRGAAATAAAVPFAAVCVVLAVLGAAAAWRRRRTVAAPTLATACVLPTVAAATLLAERAGYRLGGFELGMLALTPPHMLYAGVVAVVLAGAIACDVPSTAARTAAWAVPGGVVVVLLGYLVGEWLELVGTLLLTGALVLAGWSAIGAGGPRAARNLLLVAAVTGVGTMALACVWALGEATGTPHPSLAVMAATHGVGNAVGVALCGVLGWRAYRRGMAGAP